MENGNDNNKPPTSFELYAEIEKRKDWFFECQLRRLNLTSFRDVTEKIPDPLLDLVSEPSSEPQIGSREKKIGQVYLDSQQPIWTQEIKDQKNVFAKSLLGLMGDWLDFKQPARLIDKLAVLKKGYEQSKFGSNLDVGELNFFGRIDLSKDKLPHTIARMAITQNKPWLIPEIFNDRNADTTDVKNWIENAESFISDFENELQQSLGGGPGLEYPFTLENTSAYQAWIKGLLETSLTRNTSDTIKVSFLDKEIVKKKVLSLEISYEKDKYNIKVETYGYKFNDISAYPFSHAVKYWVNSCHNSLLEVYLNKDNSDMGLCLIMRALYLYGTLPATMGTDEQLGWRKRQLPGSAFQEFFSKKKDDPLIKNNTDLQYRLLKVQIKLQTLLEQTAACPRSGALGFSSIAQEIIKQCILRYKFWIDEQFRAFDNDGNPGDEDKLSGINKARVEIGVGKIFTEMEYWSENHYIMYASSEYLAGQLWENDTFQPAKDFLNPALLEDKSGKLIGKQRMERGKARILKWLNNKLMFGWTEFNSSGYYREHLWSLLNLVDFALDKEVRDKATIVTDLLLFDAIRFSHKGSMGAAGGRSQFKSKHCGWDGALGDVLEIALGSRGIFLDESGEIGCCFATTSYKIPDVLLQIGSFYPNTSVVDRSRVSISFEEAPKYGIDYSQKSDQRASLYEGFAPKRAKHFKFLKTVNDEITRIHSRYATWQEDTIFWWSMSAFYNKQVVKNTFRCITDFGLSESEIFKGFVLTIVKKIMPFLEATFNVNLDTLTGAGPFSAVAGFFADVSISTMIEEGSDDLSLLLDGSTRTRANIHTYRNRDVMLSSLQNFRTGQLNFQTNVNQATLNSSVNIFTTAAFSGIDLSDIETGLLGGMVGFAVGGPVGAVVGVIGGVAANKKLESAHLLVEEEDGPSWWTGYWALPMVVQHESAAIIAYDFTVSQKQLANTGSHVWFPKTGFYKTEERRTSAYDDDNFFLLDITDIGPEGFWLFGKIMHQKNTVNPELNEEGYIGVFSNQRPEWLDKDSDFYSEQVEEKKEQLKTNLAWDFFADKDWYVEGKNIWIIQVGNKDEFGSFDNFKDRVSKAKVTIDDAGDMDCSYNIPKKDGSSQTLSLKYGDEGEFSLDGKPFQTDLYPRFENPFVRGGCVEWGQREYVIEYNGKHLMHDFSDMEHPVRSENETRTPGDADTIKGLVIYLKTADEEMEIFTRATATVHIGSRPIAVDEVVAAGKVDEDTTHDAEWIFFDMPIQSNPDMTIDIGHHIIPGKDADLDNEWKMTYSLKALMGDRSLKQCTAQPIPLQFGKYYFSRKSRNTGQVPFSVQLSLWRTWGIFGYTHEMKSWMIAGQPGNDFFYFDYLDVLAIDKDNILLHRRDGVRDSPSTWTKLTGKDNEPILGEHFNLFPYSTRPDHLFLFLISEGSFFVRWLFPGNSWFSNNWTKMNIIYQPMIKMPFTGIAIPDTSSPSLPVPIGLLSRVYATFINYSDPIPAVYVSGADGNFYVSSKWPFDTPGNWRQIETASDFTILHEVPFQVGGNFLFALDHTRTLWRYSITPGKEDKLSSWQQIPSNEFTIQSFTIAASDDMLQVLVRTSEAEVWAIRLNPGPGSNEWIHVGIGFKTSRDGKISCTSAITGRLDIFVAGIDDKLYTTWWTEETGWENDNNWVIVDEKSQEFKVPGKGNLTAISRVNGQIEIFATDLDHNIWKNWWS